MYTLYNGPLILAVSDDMNEIMSIRDKQPAKIRPFLSIGEKGIGCTIKLTSDDIESKIKEPVTARNDNRPIDKMYLPPIDIPDGEYESQESYCFACGEKIKGPHLYTETHGDDGYSADLAQPRTSAMCWDCASEFRRQMQGREYKMTDFFEVRK